MMVKNRNLTVENFARLRDLLNRCPKLQFLTATKLGVAVV